MAKVFIFLLNVVLVIAKPDENDKIVGGHEVSPGQYPWVLGIWYKGTTRFPFCGASLITDRWVLTAAHCVYTKNHRNLKIVAGDHDTYDFTESGQQQREICSKKIHHGYTGSVDHDIALLELCDPVKFNHRVQPIGLAPINLEFDDKANSTVAGWGTMRESGTQSHVLRAVSVPIVDSARCNKAYGFISKYHICAGEYFLGGRDSCQGDSGGPLWYKDTLTLNIYQVGVVSSGNGCARPNYPGIYMRISAYHDWILDTMADFQF